MPQKILYPVTILVGDLLPTDWLGELNGALGNILIDPSENRLVWTNEILMVETRIYLLPNREDGSEEDEGESDTSTVVQPIQFDLPLISGARLILGDGTNLFNFLFKFSSSPIITFVIDDVEFTLHLPANIIQEYESVDDNRWESRGDGYNFTFSTGLQVDFEGNFDLEVPQLTGLPPFMISDSGFILDFRESRDSEEVGEIQFVNATLPESLVDRVPLGFKGLFLQRVWLHYFKEGSGTELPPIGLADAAIGSGGFSGSVIMGNEQIEPAVTQEQLNADDFDPSRIDGGITGYFEISGMRVLIWHLRASFLQSVPNGFLITGLTYMPFAEKWITFQVNVGGPDADFLLEIGGTADAPLIDLDHDLLEIHIDSIAYKTEEDIHYAIISGSVRPKIEGFDWPRMQVNELSISSEGDIDIPGGWLRAPNTITFDFNAFRIGIREIGFGNEKLNEGTEEEEERQWIGFSGEFRLVEGIPLAASVEGLKFSWLKDPSDDDRDVKVSMTGVGVAFAIPGTLEFSGSLSYKELKGDEPDNPMQLRGTLFKGNIELNIMVARMRIDAQLMAGKLTDANGNTFTTFFIFLGAEFPAAIPLGATGVGLYGISGLVGLNVATTKTEEQNWYQWYNAEPARNITSIQKWQPYHDQFAFGAGVRLGTQFDDGYTINMGVMLVVLIPGPVVILEGKANLLKQRTEGSDEEGAFYLLAVFDGRAGTFQLNIDVRYSLEDVITVSAGLEAFFDFNNSDNWYIYIGRKEPAEKRIRAEILSIIQANAYFMIDNNSLLTGASIGVEWRYTYGPVALAIVARLSFDASIFWKPLQLEGSLELYGEFSLTIFGIGIELLLELLLAGKAPEPYRIQGRAHIRLNLFWPIPELELDVEFIWEQPGEIQPVWPLLKSVGMVHHKDTSANFPLELQGEEAPPWSDFPVIPVDARPIVTFARPVHNLYQHATEGASNPPKPLFGEIKDIVNEQEFVYRLENLELEAWEDGSWNSVLSGVNTGADNAFIIDHDSIRNRTNTKDPNEPEIQLWKYTAAGHTSDYERENYSERYPVCESNEEPRMHTVNWRGVPAGTAYPFQFVYERLNFAFAESQPGWPAPRANNYLSGPDHCLISFPEPVYFVEIELSGEMPDTEGTIYADGLPVAEMAGSSSEYTLSFRGPMPFDAVYLHRDQGLEIYQIRYQTIAEIARIGRNSRDPHPRVREQNVIGAPPLRPNHYYRLRIQTDVTINNEALEAEGIKPPKEQYAYFRTDAGPGIDLIRHLEAGDFEEIAYKEQKAATFATYVKRTLPLDGAKQFYYSYDAGIQFNEPYFEHLYENPIEIRFRDRNGRVAETSTGRFVGDIPIRSLEDHLIDFLSLQERNGCTAVPPADVRASYLRFPLSTQLRPNRQYTAEVSTIAHGESVQLHRFQFNTSRYASFGEHIVGTYLPPEEDPDQTIRIPAITLPSITMETEATISPAFAASRSFRELTREFGSRTGNLEHYFLYEETRGREEELIRLEKQSFNELDTLILPAFEIINMVSRPEPLRFEIFQIPVRFRTVDRCILLFESPEPIDWLRVTASFTVAGETNEMDFVWNEDQTRAFAIAVENDSHLFENVETTIEMTFTGDQNAEQEILLRDGLVVNERIEFQLDLQLEEEAPEELDQLQILTEFYHSTGGPAWADNTNWLSDEPLESWHGLSIHDGEVTHIILPENNLRGRLPESLGGLTRLRRLNLASNELTGAIPDSLGHMPNLRNFQLNRNNLSGRIPQSLAESNSLSYLYLSHNQLEGPVPAGLLALPSLVYLYAQGNGLSGTLPDEIPEGSNLRILLLSGNNLTGSIPTSIGNATELSRLNLSGNQLSGPIPETIINCRRLTILHIYNNNLSGSLPAGLLALPELRAFHLSGNQFTGNIPDEIPSESPLVALDARNNDFTGSIPGSIGNATALRSLQLNSNSLSGAIPASIRRCRQLSRLNLSANELTDGLPAGLLSIPTLSDLRISQNQLSGPIPDEIPLGSSLRRILLNNNNLNGPVPASIVHARDLQHVNLSNNQLSGCYPTAFRELCDGVRVSFSKNPDLPAGGDFASYCSGNIDECGEPTEG